MNRTYLISAIIALAISLGTIGGFLFFSDKGKTIKIEHIPASTANGVDYPSEITGERPFDFTQTAEKVVDAVVFIKSTQNVESLSDTEYRQLPDPFRDFFGDFFGERYQYSPPQDNGKKPRQFTPKRQPRVGSGSGVIINENGYIITNNHVIDNADDVEVTLHDNRTYKATVVGTDPTSDLALLQIKEKNLPTLPFVNSDEVKIGEWVLAVGNPLGLTSTVTAGIVSAKGRNININREKFAIESFIQTDAAINPGNSGGALVDVNGGLIGVNTAIASPTGSYSGYGFAVPSNIVNKVVEDLVKYGVVQRGVLGVMIRSVDGNLAKDKDLELNTGAYVDSLLDNSAAGAAGIKPGDVIVKIDDMVIETSPELQEAIARHRPGDKIDVTVNRKGNEKTFKVVLNNMVGSKEVTKNEHKEMLGILGANLETVEKAKAKELDIDGGVKVTDLFAGKIRKETQMREGFIITHVDGRKVKSVDDLMDILEKKEGGVMLEGVYEDQLGKHYYAFGM